ncbi:MAG: Lrp/AsnC family transcriptional regulator [Candidatus Micrarchaeota archaeon]|nr:Lrp/AsnC family transcriptional regulator [Candidatus Micrarchaeota archaeon]
MQQSSIKLTKTERRFLISLTKGGDKNDSEIAKEMKVSKGTVSRIRKKLTEEGLLAGATPKLDLEKMGVCFYYVLVFQWNAFADRKLTEKMEKDFTSTAQTIYFAEGSNPNSKYIAKMAFVDFEDYNEFIAEFRRKYGASISGLETFFIQPKRILKEDYGDLVKMLIGGV